MRLSRGALLFSKVSRQISRSRETKNNWAFPDCNSSWQLFFKAIRQILSLHGTNKANLRDLIAETGLVILLKLDSNHWFSSHYDIEIRWMTWKTNRAPLLGYIKLCALFQALLITSEPSVNSNWRYNPETLNSGQNWRFFCPVWHWNLTDDIAKQ